MTQFLDYIARHATALPDALAVSDDGEAVSWRRFAEITDSIAECLSEGGVARGDRVAVLELNTVAFAELTVAVAKAGAILVPLNWRLTPTELARLVTSADPSVLFIGSSVAELGAALTDFVNVPLVVAIDGETYGSWRNGRPSADWRPASELARSPACITYTSGSTGEAKGVVMPHSSFATVLPGVVEAEGITNQSITAQVLPLFHIGGLAWLISAFIAGAQSVLLPTASPTLILAAIERHRITHLCLVSTLLQALVDEQRRNPVAVSSVEMIQCGASPMPESYLREAGRVFDCNIVTLYGLSEAGGLVCNQIITPAEIEAGLGRRLLASGWPVAGVDVEIRRSGAPFDRLPMGEVGEIVTRTPGAMLGYWRQPQLTAQTMSKDGWLRTGDLGYVDPDGLLYVSGRLKDLIISGGENIYPAEIENVIAEHPKVAQVAVVGAPHPKWGESPVAVVTPEQGVSVESAEVLSWCKERLASYRNPQAVVVVDALPLLGGGKVDRPALRRQVVDQFT